MRVLSCANFSVAPAAGCGRCGSECGIRVGYCLRSADRIWLPDIDKEEELLEADGHAGEGPTIPRQARGVVQGGFFGALLVRRRSVCKFSFPGSSNPAVL